MVAHVRTAQVKVTSAPRILSFPGNIQAFDSAIIYARATGYIATRNVDIGSRVKAGDVLAVIAAPDLDQQLVQARAQLVQMEASINQARANQDLAQRTNVRTTQLVAARLAVEATRRSGSVDGRRADRRTQRRASEL